MIIYLFPFSIFGPNEALRNSPSKVLFPLLLLDEGMFITLEFFFRLIRQYMLVVDEEGQLQ